MRTKFREWLVIGGKVGLALHTPVIGGRLSDTGTNGGVAHGHASDDIGVEREQYIGIVGAWEFVAIGEFRHG
jgi:hypothetical protein